LPAIHQWKEGFQKLNPKWTNSSVKLAKELDSSQKEEHIANKW
jgi:hypothetical protein